MKILGIDSSGLVASVAIVDGDTLVAEYTMNYKKTHSQTLLPMLDEIVKMAEINLESIDAIAVSAGPGSFTGLRIGAATAKGLGLALDKKIVPIPTCEGLAFNMWGNSDVICPIMDARRNQVYTGLYNVTDTVEVLMDQEAMDIHELIQILNEKWSEVTFLGDGVTVFKKVIEEELQVPFRFAPAQMNMQRASSVAMLGARYFEEGKAVLSDDFAPIYLRKSQAEREREERLKNQ